MISLDLYRIFVIVANEGNITKASEILHISQPAITKHIQNLEDQLHIKLFDRSKKGVTLTETGLNIYNKVKNCVNIMSNIENTINSPNEIKYGARESIFKYIFSDIFFNFSKSNPYIPLLSFKDAIPEMLKKLNNYELDIVLTKKPLIDTSNFENIKFVKLGEIHSIFITNKNSKFAKKSYSVEDLKSEIIYTNMATATSITQLLSILNIPENSKNIIPIGIEPMKKLLLNNDAIGFITKEFVNKELTAGIYDLVKTDFELEPSDYGFYFNIHNRFEALNKLMDYLKT